MKNNLLEELSEPIKAEILKYEQREKEFIEYKEYPDDHKIYNLSKQEQIACIKQHTNFLNNISLKNMIQLEVDFEDNVYIL